MVAEKAKAEEAPAGAAVSVLNRLTDPLISPSSGSDPELRIPSLPVMDRAPPCEISSCGVTLTGEKPKSLKIKDWRKLKFA